jgi:hypothetical protein
MSSIPSCEAEVLIYPFELKRKKSTIFVSPSKHVGKAGKPFRTGHAAVLNQRVHPTNPALVRLATYFQY